MHNEHFVSPRHPSRFICQYAASYFHIQDGFSLEDGRASMIVMVRWIPPTPDWVRINTDGAARGLEGVAWCGGVLRDNGGQWVCGFAKPLGQSCAYIAELWVAYEGLLLAHRRGMTVVELQLDSRVMVNNLQGKDAGSVQGWSLVHRIRGLLALPWRVKINHIYCEANSAAYCLANLGCDLGEYQMFEDAPPQVRQMVFADFIGVSAPRSIRV